MLRILFLVFLSIYTLDASYVPPAALVEPLKPTGLRISIPDEDGISLVAFHVKFNEEFDGLEAGAIARDYVRPKNGRWTYKDKTTRLKQGDIIYYWIHVVYDGLGYNLVDQEYTVEEFYDYNGQRINTGDDDNPHKDVNQSCLLSTTKLYDQTGASTHPCSGELIFEDDFKNSNFKNVRWSVVEQFSGAPDYEFVVYRDSNKNIKLGNGLKITPKLLTEEYDDAFIRRGTLSLENCTGNLNSGECRRRAYGSNILPPITSGQINTQKYLNFEYGRVEIKAKFPTGDWIYPLLVLESVKNANGVSFTTDQIRIASAVGNTELRLISGKDISGHALWGGVIGNNELAPENRLSQERTMKFNNKMWSEDFHVYELIWSPSRIVLKVDGQNYYEKESKLPTNIPFYLTIGLAAGGYNEFPDYAINHGSSKPWRNVDAKGLYHFYNSIKNWSETWEDEKSSLYIDYAKIWAL